ncbi:MAG: transposase family protein [Pseudonocardia sp.]|jgi:transposase|nr:transposase family protein [Pseudonocardia sp.]
MRHVERAWAGIDAGKGHHHLVVIDQDGTRLLSRRVANAEPDLAELIDTVQCGAEALTWAIDLTDGPATLVIALLLERGQRLVHVPGIAVNRAADAYRGEGKTDARDAAVIADQARMRRDLRLLRLDEPAIAELRMLTTHRADLVCDRTRTINRLRGRLAAACPTLEAALDLSNHGPLLLISQFPTATAIRAAGLDELHRWLRTRHVRGAAALAARAHAAAAAQHVRIPGEDTAGLLIARLAMGVLDLNAQLADLDTRIAERFRTHPDAAVLTSMIGIGDLLGAEFVAATGGSLDAFASADHLAGYAGLAPTPRDSGSRIGNLHRPRRYNRQLQRVFYTSALISIQRSPASRGYYQRKRAEGKRHRQAVLALARRRVNVLWAMLRDQHSYQEPDPAPATAA